MNAILDSFADINKVGPQPIYVQIKNLIEQHINSGAWLAGQKLPSENELVAALDVSRMTINRALRELTQQGLIKRVHGLGSFVAETPRHASLLQLQDIALEIEAQGKRHHVRVLQQQSLVAPRPVAQQMGLAGEATIYLLRAVHYQDDLPIQLETRFVNPVAMPDFLQQDFTRMTATAYLLEQFKPDEMEHRVRAFIPDESDRELLMMANNLPCLQLTRRTWKDDLVVTYVTLTYPGDRYQLEARYATDEYQLR